jgi:2-polyprenyl-3-methyl-5-hydroxy-6-metoxy-1,4-benzoquinol methylase
MAFWPAKVLLSAVELGLFTALAAGPLSGPELRAALQLHPRADPDFFDTLVALRLLDREGDGAEARYRNTGEAALFLDRDSPQYVGGILEMANARLYRFWADLTEGLRTGQPQNEIKHSGASMFAALYSVPERLEQFMNAMSGISKGNFQALAEKFDFSRYRTLCDVGGATGQLSMAVARRHPHLRCVSADLPAVVPIAERHIAAAGLANRVTATALDFFAEPLPQADVITMGLILHDWNLEKKMHLIRAAHAALPRGGAFIVGETLIDDARRENAFGLMMSLNMLIEFGDAFDFTGADFARWCREAGFSRTEIIPLGGPASAAVAYK